MFGQVFYIAILLQLTTVAALFGCNNKKNCKDCVSSWIKCRWCYRDRECHDPGAIATNPCKRAENIVEKSRCDDKLSHYDPELSMKMLLLSAAAYDPNDPQGCLNNSLPSAEFKIVSVSTKTCDDSRNECSAYVAVSDVLKAIVVSFRGSLDSDQARKVFLEGLVEPKKSFLDGEVQSYWKRGFEELWSCMKGDVKALVSNNPSYQVWVTGHSLGGAMASMASTWLSYYKVLARKNIILYTFGMPRVGNYDYAFQHDQLVNNSWRVVNYDDAVPHFPTFLPKVVNGPYHHGVEAYYRVKATSPYSSHTECHGKPYNEDVSCSFSTLPSLDFKTHKIYFSIPVGTFWETRCLRLSRKKRETTGDSKSTPKMFQFKQGTCSKYKYKSGSYLPSPEAYPVRNSGHIALSKQIITIQLFLYTMHLSRST